MDAPVQAQGQDSIEVDRLAVRRHPLIARIERSLQERCGVDLMRANIVVGISGGADSTALLLALDAIASRGDARNVDSGGRSITLTPVCVHHHIRRDADGEVAHVEALCDALGLALDVEHVFPKEVAGNLAANAREMRYAALADVANRAGAGFVAVAHHADDQLETMLMALCRGAGPRGLRGMRWSRALAAELQLIRPLLGVSKAACESLCDAAGVGWIEDASNLSADAARGRLRRDVLPVLEDMWPGCSERASRAADAMAAANAALLGEVVRVFGDRLAWERSDLADVDEHVLMAGLMRAFERATARRIGGEIAVDGFRAAVRAIRSNDRSPKQFELADGWLVSVRSKRVEMVHDDG